eukprot:TRINITY_DN81790_c0_g1_i1.p1 TRINITY_DN81790_c0_g1~~TRINITY_DN81790_c0_g1_i1.p1  ORF type:complete len:489 (-),score=112.33 TRINITY_DN81790_c0_g1_i1:77-1486(-)
MAAVAARPTLEGLPPLQQPLWPAQQRPELLRALRAFFEVSAKEGHLLSSSSAVGHAEALADYLCSSEMRLSAAALAGYARSPSSKPASPQGRCRALLTGCFDLTHAGHYNALRQAKAAFPDKHVTLVAGVHSDEAIVRAKGAPTVLNHEERLELVKNCRWVDEVVGNLPYAVPVSLLDELNCDVAVHGDDLPKVPGGGGLFDEVQAAGRLHVVKRTEGTSTTMLIGRLLSMSKEHLLSHSAQEEVPGTPQLLSERTEASPETAVSSIGAPIWTLLPTMSRMALFYSDRRRAAGGGTRVVYAPGEWDLFHIGHIRFLEQARRLGDVLIVGLYDDETIHRKKGKNYPLQTLHERALNVLACRHVDDVLLGAPWQASKDLLKTLNVAVLVTGSNNQYADPLPQEQDVLGLGDPFVHARATKILKVLDSDCELTMDVIAERILKNTSTYLLRQSAKEPAEQAYMETKEYVAEK